MLKDKEGAMTICPVIVTQPKASRKTSNANYLANSTKQFTWLIAENIIKIIIVFIILRIMIMIMIMIQPQRDQARNSRERFILASSECFYANRSTKCHPYL